jgi:hypothetical protein
MGIATRGSWKPGQSGNANGRPDGSRNNRTKDIVLRLISLGHKDPLETLSELQNSSTDEAIRATAANMLAPYLHGKLVPRPSPVFMEQNLSIPKPTTIDEAVNNIAYLSQLKSTGQIDRDWGDNLIADQRAMLGALVDEAKLAAGVGTGDQIIRIEGGLPPLSGTEIIMPVLPRDSVTGPLAPTKDSFSPLEPLTPVVPATTLQRIESALLAWSEGGRKGNVEIDGPTWDDMATVPRDALQALFDRYGVACPLASADGEGATEG